SRSTVSRSGEPHSSQFTISRCESRDVGRGTISVPCPLSLVPAPYRLPGAAPPPAAPPPLDAPPPDDPDPLVAPPEAPLPPLVPLPLVPPLRGEGVGVPLV